MERLDDAESFKHNDNCLQLVNVPVLNGFIFRQILNFKDLVLGLNVSIPTYEQVVIQDFFGVSRAKSPHRDFVASLKWGPIACDIGKNSVLASKIQYRSFAAVGLLNLNDFRLKIASSFQTKAFAMRCDFNERIVEGLFRLDNCKFGIRRSELGVMGLFDGKYKDFHGQLEMSLDGSMGSIGLSKKVSDHLFGVVVQMSQRHYLGHIAWRLNINDYVIHSSVSTQGLVSTYMTTKLNDNCIIGVGASLDHLQNRYRTGLSLQFGNHNLMDS